MVDGVYEISVNQQLLTYLCKSAIINVSLSINIVSVSIHGIELLSIPSVNLSVCLSVCLSRKCTVAKRLIGSWWDGEWGRLSDGCIRLGCWSSNGKGQFYGWIWASIVTNGDLLHSCVEVREPIKLSFGVEEWGWWRDGCIRRVHVPQGKGDFGWFSPHRFREYFLNTSTHRICGSILMMYASYDVFPCKDVLFGGSVDISLYLRGHIPKSLILGAWIGIFKPNMRNIQTFIWHCRDICSRRMGGQCC